MVDERVMQKVYDLLNVYHASHRVDNMSPAAAQMEYHALLARGLTMPPTLAGSYKGLTYTCDADEELFELGGKGKQQVVYYFYGAGNVLLYVGRTDCFATRWMGHIASDKPMHQVCKVELRLFDTKPETMFYESQEIVALQPPWNKAGLSGKASKQQIYPTANFWFDCKIRPK